MKKILTTLFLAFMLIQTGYTQEKLQKPQQDISKKYPKKIGNLRFKVDFISFHQIKNTEVKKDSIIIYNDWKYPLIIKKFKHVPTHITVVAVPDTLQPKQEGKIYVTFDAPKCNNWGFLYRRPTLVTNDSLNREKSINISVNIVEDFTHLTQTQIDNAPKVVFNTKKYDFGTVKQGEIVNYNFVLTNQGNDDLLIRKTKASCGCTATKPEKKILKKDESCNIKISFNTRGRKGRQHKTVNVITNDPKNSNITLHIEGVIELPAQHPPK